MSEKAPLFTLSASISLHLLSNKMTYSRSFKNKVGQMQMDMGARKRFVLNKERMLWEEEEWCSSTWKKSHFHLQLIRGYRWRRRVLVSEGMIKRVLGEVGGFRCEQSELCDWLNGSYTKGSCRFTRSSLINFVFVIKTRWRPATVSHDSYLRTPKSGIGTHRGPAAGPARINRCRQLHPGGLWTPPGCALA